jgi:hypothetical protein
MHRSGVILAAVAAASLCAAQAAEAGDNPLIAQGIQEYNDLMYEESVNTLSAALMRSGNSDSQLIEIYKYLGLNYLLLEKADEADGSFRQLLIIDDTWEFDAATTSPKITTFFNNVKQKWIAEGKPGKIKVVAPVTIQHKVPDKGIKTEAINLKFTVKDPDMTVKKVSLFVKSGKKFVEYKATPSTPPVAETVYMATIPGDLVLPPNVDYFLGAMDYAGNMLATRGDKDAPLRITVPGEEKVSVVKKWWFWTIIGVAVAGIAGGIAGGVVAANKRTNGNTGDPANFVINICETGDTACP